MGYPAATTTGRWRYPPDGVVHCEGEDHYCVCLSDCARDCMGECGCDACRSARLDYLHGSTASPAEREEFQLRDRIRRVPMLRDLAAEIEQAQIDQENLERIKYGWSLVDKTAMSAKTRLLAWLSDAGTTGIEPETLRAGLFADGLIEESGDLADAGRSLIFGTSSAP